MNKEEVAFRDTPWLTEGANIYLVGFLKKNFCCRILEFGMGGSTLFFTMELLINHLVSIEHDDTWFKRIVGTQAELIGNPLWGQKEINNHLLDRPYHGICGDFKDNYFDIILVDGRDRVKCIEASIPKLRSGGILILDNSERENYKPGIELMKGWNTIITKQMHPDRYNFYYPGWETSIFIKPK